FSAERLKSVIRTSESGWFAFLKTTDTYDADRVQGDRELLRAFYAKSGYADARVTAAVATYDPASKGIVLSFAIDKGSRYRLGVVDIESHVAAVDAAALRGTLRIAAGDIYNGEAVDKSAEELALALGKGGHRFVSVRPQLRR